ncbi:putative benzoate 4-monooxygenase cytochrome p450 protein [Botryosphaeria dothidea]|uniref:Benzoate 4-monooxygenase cytochrome p450 protein n=1 Tax=Botryosphaeria dothidea TaxID=55169 RepID=A0A8H4N7J5_9PEZI|nr:putative benzoate 4-monooxygenase cytochrome p450 protein [Botryosphaeria dothidea]
MALLTLVLVLAATLAAYRYYFHPLRRIPGPLLAKFTDAQRFFDTAGGRAELTHRLLHAKYGPVVRIGPNTVSLSDPECIKLIYSNKANFPKSNFYAVNDITQGEQRVCTLFGTRDNAFHARLRAPVQKYYKVSELLKLEHRVDRVIEDFCSKLEQRFANPGKPCDIAEWFLFYAWDAISDVTFSNPIKEGFLNKGGDIDDLLSTAEQALDYFAAVGQIPILDEVFDKNPVRRIGPPSFQAAADFCVKKLVARVSGEETNDTANQDYLDHFLAIKAADPSVTDATVVGWMLLNILAGADTTATTLTAVLYHLLKNPACLAKLKRELDAAALPRPVRYQDAAALPYLDACVKEALRVHPGVGLLLERVVPREGLALPAGGVFLPPGTVVGMNAWVVNNDKGVFGADAESFRPERWVRGEAEPEAAYEERAKRMRDVMLSFGAGRRVCLGRELSLFEIYKVVPMVVGLFDFELTDQKKEWELTNSWFVRVKGVDVRIKSRTLPN